MDLKKLVDDSVKILEAEFKGHPEKKNVYSVKINFDDNQHETVNIYEDEFEDSDGEISNIIVCETAVSKYDPDIVDTKDLLNYNRDLFFSRLYISEDKKIVIESCIFSDNISSKKLSSIIDEIAETSNDIRNTLL